MTMISVSSQKAVTMCVGVLNMLITEFAKSFTDLDQAVVLLGPDGKVAAVNPAYVHLTHRREEDVLGKRCAELHQCREYTPPGASTIRWLRGGTEEVDSGTAANLCERCPLKYDKHWAPALAWLHLSGQTEPIPVSVDHSRLADDNGKPAGLLLFFQVTSELHAAASSSQRELRKLGRELAAAAELEHLLTPYRMEPLPGLEIAGVCLSLRPLGGDFIEVFRLAAGGVMYLADLSGNSSQAGILLPTVRGLCHRELQTAPPASMANLNRVLLAALPEETFLALSLAFYDRTSFTLVNAGNTIWRYRRAEGAWTPVEGQAMVLGVESDVDYAPVKVYLDQGDMIAMWSDGVSDSLEGTVPVETLLSKLSTAPSGKLEESCRQALRLLPRDDDASLLVVRR